MEVKLNIYQTMAAAIAVYYLGVWLRYKIGFLRKYCIPAPIVGGHRICRCQLRVVCQGNLDV